KALFMRILKSKGRAIYLLCAICLSFFVATAKAQNDLGSKTSSAALPSTRENSNQPESVSPAGTEEVEQLKADFARQQKQITELQKALEGQQRLIEQLLHNSPRSTTAEEAST